MPQKPPADNSKEAQIFALEQDLLVLEARLRELKSKQSGGATPLPASSMAKAAIAGLSATILDAVPASIAVLRPNGVITHVNAQWRAFGEANGLHLAGHAVGINYLEICDRVDGAEEDEVRRIAGNLRAVLNGSLASCSHDYPCHSPDQRRWFRMMVASLPFSGPHGAVVIHVDITERVLAEEKLRRNAEHYQLLFDSNPQPMWVFDMKTLRFLAVNEAAIRDYGFSREEFLVMTIEDIRPEEDVPLLREVVAAKALGLSHSGLWRHRIKSGEIILTEIRSHTIVHHDREAKLVTALNVTGRIEAELALRRSEARLRAIFDSEPECVKTISVSGELLEMNPAGLKMIEAKDVADACSKPILEYIHPDQREAFLDLHAAVCRGENRGLLYQVLGKRGKRTWVETNATPLRDEEGRITSVLSVTRDVTDRIRAEEALRRSESIVRFAASLAHLGGWELQLPSREIIWTDSVREIYEAEPDYTPTLEARLSLFLPKYRNAASEALRRCIEEAVPWDLEVEIETFKGRRLWLRSIGEPVLNGAGEVVRIQGATQDITARKKTELQLLEGQSLLRVAGKIARVGGWSLDLPHNDLQVTDEVLELIGLPTGSRFPLELGLSLHPPEWRTPVEEALLRCALDGTPYILDVEVLRVDGTRRWARISGEPICDAQGEVIRIVGAFQDIHEQVEAEAELRASEARFRMMLEDIPNIAIRGMDAEGTIVYWNNASEVLLGHTAERAIGCSVFELIVPPDSHEDLKARLKKAIRSGEGFPSGETTLVRKDGSLVTVHSSPVVVNRASANPEVYCLDVDLTEEKKLQSHLKENEERLRHVSRATVDTIWDWNLVTDNIWWSESLESAFGYKIDELPQDSRSWTDAIHPEDLERVLESIHTVLESGMESWESKYRFRRRDGKWAHVVDRGTVLRDEEGNAVRMVGGITDITERLSLEEQLRQSQRLESVGHLTGGIAHDFNNLLTVVLGNAEFLIEELAGNPDLLPFAEMIGKAAGRGAELTHRLLAFARRQALQPQSVDVNALIWGMKDMLRRTLGEHVEVELATGDQLWNAFVDAAQLESALLNLAINARDAMPNGGKILIETSNIFLGQDYAARHSDVKPGEYVLVAVSDQGVGIPPENHPRLFEPFFTTKPPGKGTGLGLPMVYGFVKQSNGHVKIYSEVGVGTVVKLYLPRILLPGDAQVGSDSEVPGTGGTEIILLVEDDDMVRQYAEAQLRILGYQVITADNGSNAMAMLAEHPEVQLLFTDVVMPGGMNGRQLADAAKARNPLLKVIFTSGYTDDALIHHGRLDPGAVLLNKPYSRADLARKLREVLDER